MAIFRDAETMEVFEVEMDFEQLQSANVYGTVYEIDGRECTRLVEEEQKDDPNWVSDRTKERRRAQGYSFNHGRAYGSTAIGCDPSQAEEYEELLRHHGCNCEVDRNTGEVMITSEADWIAANKARGTFNGRDGFGIPTEHGGYELTGQEQVKAREKMKEQIRKSVETGAPLPPEMKQTLAAFEGI